jgi:hypothetical protein
VQNKEPVELGVPDQANALDFLRSVHLKKI